MKKSKFVAALILAIISLHASQSLARDARMMFWYPGEAGSTEEAQPVLDSFFNYISQEMGTIKIKGRYFNTVKGGLNYIMKKKPKVGIVSYAAWKQNQGQLGGAKVVMATLPLPGGKNTVRYGLVCAAKTQETANKIFSSEPLKMSYVKQNLFPDIKYAAAIEMTNQIFANIKKIADGSIKACAILTPMETATLEKLDSPWTKSLKIVKKSQPVPTARVVLFDEEWKGAGKLTEALIAAGKDPKAVEILEELRLKGFENAN